MDAVLTLYENGWSKIKFYFIIGLPTETKEDIDEMAALLDKIKYRVKTIKREKELKHSLDMTCTLSIFVPKPFTPFQWFPQADLDVVTERIHYLKDKTKHIKGLKINYHEQAVSRIEAVLTRGDESLCDYIEKLWQKGCYLDAWGEHFDRQVWRETAEELGISLEELAQKEYKLEEELPWDFIDIGVEKNWLIEQYKEALKNNTKPSCETGCVDCGVCKNFKTKKVMDKPYEGKQKTVNGKQQELVLQKINPITLLPNQQQLTAKYRIKLTKKDILRYFSHLDWQNTFLKSLSRSGLDIAFSQGFNPTMKLSLGVALPLFVESECELVDIELKEEIEIETLKLKLEKVLPKGCEIISIVKLDKGTQAIDNTVQWAEYEIRLFKGAIQKFETLSYNMNKVLSSDEILLTKKNKKGFLKTTNIKPSIRSYRFDDESLFIVLKAGQGSDIPAIRADDLMKIIAPDILFDIKRVSFFNGEYEKI